MNENTSSQASNTSSSKLNTSGKKRPINRGLDGGYWSTLPLNDSGGGGGDEGGRSSRGKRRRTTVGRLDLSALGSSRQNYSADESMTTFTTDNESSVKNFDETSQNTESTTMDSKGEKRFLLFHNKNYLTVRNETGGFFLCQAVEKIYDDSKTCKIQWLEEAGENKYKLGYVDRVDPLTIITKVNVRQLPKTAGNTLYEIVEEDLKKVNDLLEKALKEGGITVEFDSDESSEEEDKAKKALENKEFYDKEEEETKKSERTKKAITSDEESEKLKKKKKIRKIEKKSESSSQESSEDEKIIKKKSIEGKKRTKLVIETDEDSREKTEKPAEKVIEPKKEATTPKPPATKSHIEIKKKPIEAVPKKPENGEPTKKTDETTSPKKVKKKSST